mgnify:CR=1 FL=1
MKQLNKSKISAVIALMLAGTILASAAKIPTNNDPIVDKDIYLNYDDEYLGEIDAMVDQYMEENIVEFETVEHIKVYDSNQELVVEGEQGELDSEQLKLLRQADLLSELNGTAYYQINN